MHCQIFIEFYIYYNCCTKIKKRNILAFDNLERFIGTGEKVKFRCPCCGNYTLNEQPLGTYEICMICNWEDDEIQYNNSTYAGGANVLCLNDARKLYKDKSKGGGVSAK